MRMRGIMHYLSVDPGDFSIFSSTAPSNLREF